MKRKAFTFFFLLALVFIPAVDLQAQVLADGQPSVLKEDQAKPGYVYDLQALIKKSRENIKNVNEKIKEQAIRKRNQKREEQARTYYEQAMKLQDEGRLEEARELFDKAIRITEHPEMKYYIKESVHRAKAQEAALKKVEEDQDRELTEEDIASQAKAEIAYQEAVNLYKQQKFKEAKIAFQAVEEAYPDYKAVRSYLQIVEQDIIQSDNLAMKEQKKEIERQQKETEIARLREKELWRKEIEKKEDDREKKLTAQADGVYNEALKLYKEKNYTAAKEKFQEVEWVVPDFKGVRAYLSRIDQDIENEKQRIKADREKEYEKQRWEETIAQKKIEDERKHAFELQEKERSGQQVDFIYVAAVALFDKELLSPAKEKFDEIEKLYPNYKSTRDYLKKIDDRLVGQKKKGEAMDRALANQTTTVGGAVPSPVDGGDAFSKIAEEADDLYNEAMNFYKMGQLVQAKQKFLEVDKRVPDYKSTRSYLKRIDDDIELLARTRKHEFALADQRAEINRLKDLKEKAEVVYTAAVGLYNAQDFSKAKLKFQEVDTVITDYKMTRSYLQRIDGDIRQQEEQIAHRENEKKAERIYAQAMASYNNEQFEEAKSEFIEVETIVPNYQQTTDYLKKVDEDIIRKKEADLARLKELQIQGPYNQAVSLYKDGDFDTAKAKFLEVLAIDPDYKDTAKFLETIDQEIEKQKKDAALRQKTEEAGALYAQALSLYQSGDFVEAKERFVKLDVLWPDYKDASQYLRRIDDDIIEKKKKEEIARRTTEADPIYVQALALYKEQEFVEAKKKFVQVRTIYPAYKETTFYLARLDQDIRDQRERTQREERNRKAEALYSRAVALHTERQFEEAKKVFLEVVSVDPAYKNVSLYLSRINADIREERIRQHRLKLEQEAEPLYANAVQEYHDKQFESAQVKFIAVARLLPDYKKTKDYLSRIGDDIRAAQRAHEAELTAKAEALYQEAMTLMADGNLPEALDKFNALEAVYPHYKATKKNMGKIWNQMAKQEAVKGSAVSKSAAKPAGEAPAPATPTVVAPAVGSAVASAPVMPPTKGLSEDDIFAIYKEAVYLYKSKKYPEAKIKFEEVVRSKPDYRSTKKYLGLINDALSVKSEAVPPAVVEAKEPPKIQPSESVQSSTEYAQRVAKADPLYLEAISLYKEGKFDEAKAKIDDVQKIIPDYKSSDRYLKLISEASGRSVKAPVSASDNDMQAIKELAKRSEKIYQQIKGLSEEKELTGTVKTFAQVDKVLASLEAEQSRLVKEIERQHREERIKLEQEAKRKQQEELRKSKEALEEKERLRQQDLLKKQKEEEQRQAELREQKKEIELKAETAYQQAINAFKEKNYVQARERLAEAKRILPNYKNTDQLLGKIERAQDEQKLIQEENADRDKVKQLADKANAINMEILALSQDRNYEAIQQKFSDIEGILKDIQAIKGGMVDRRDQWAVRWEGKAASRTSQKGRAAKPPEPLTAEMDGRTAKDKARVMFREGEQLYSAQSYPEARVKFLEAVKLDPKLKSAATYVRRIDRLLEQRDFEDQRSRDKREIRGLEQKQETQEGLAAETPEQSALGPEERAKALMQEGMDLYKAKRWKEAQIKFEGISKVGDEKEQARARRYLTLIDQNLGQEKVRSEKERKDQQERYLRERREKEHLAEGSQKEEATDATGRDLDIQRKLTLRSIEQENIQERQRMLDEKSHQEQQAVKKDNVEREKYETLGVQEGLPLEGQVETPEEKMAEKAVPVAEKTETLDPEKIKAERNKAREDAQRERRLANARAKLKREDRKYQEDLDQERRKFMAEKELLEKAHGEQDRSMRQRQQGMKTGPEARSPVSQEAEASVGKASLGVAAGGPGLQAKVDDEKRLLEEQRAAIRRDFEAGVERLYQEAIGFYKKRSYEEARQDFLQVDEMIKGYKKTSYYLNQIDKVMPSRKVTSVAASPVMPLLDMKKTQPVLPASAKTRAEAVAETLDTFDPSVKK